MQRCLAEFLARLPAHKSGPSLESRPVIPLEGLFSEQEGWRVMEMSAEFFSTIFLSVGQEGGYAAVVVGLMARNRLLFR